MFLLVDAPILDEALSNGSATDAGHQFTTVIGEDIDMDQSGWRWCKNCAGLYFSDNGKRHGVCPASKIDAQSPHVEDSSGDYTLIRADPGAPPQHGWRWCKNCEGLFFAGRHNEYGVCPSHSMEGKRRAHEIGGDDYAIVLNNPGHSGQKQWRWCKKCEGLFFSGGGSLGICPSDKKAHLVGESDYSLIAKPIAWPGPFVNTEDGRQEFGIKNGEVIHRMPTAHHDFRNVNDGRKTKLNNVIAVYGAAGEHIGGVHAVFGWIGGESGPLHLVALTSNWKLWYIKRRSGGHWSEWECLSEKLQLPPITQLVESGWSISGFPTFLVLNDAKELTLSLEGGGEKWVQDKHKLPRQEQKPAVVRMSEYKISLTATNAGGVVIASEEYSMYALNDEHINQYLSDKLLTWQQGLNANKKGAWKFVREVPAT